jgi:hypothetical protein
MFSFSRGTSLSYFEYLTSQEDKTELNEFNAAMARSVESDRLPDGRNFLDAFPFEKELGHVPPEEVAIVDIGGGYGHLIREVRRRLTGVKGKLVVQDLPETVAGANLPDNENIEAVGYNFFKAEQPLRGAHIYILRHVLHDWSDRESRAILANMRPALVKGKSRLLVIEIILEKTGTSAWGALMDLMMMQYGGMGRKERQWRELFESAGYKLVKVWPAVKDDAIMELVPADW